MSNISKITPSKSSVVNSKSHYFMNLLNIDVEFVVWLQVNEFGAEEDEVVFGKN